MGLFGLDSHGRGWSWPDLFACFYVFTHLWSVFLAKTVPISDEGRITKIRFAQKWLLIQQRRIKLENRRPGFAISSSQKGVNLCVFMYVWLVGWH
jgi:hypothetical protein